MNTPQQGEKGQGHRYGRGAMIYDGSG